MHNHNEGSGKSMMWMMLPCLLLLAVVIFGGSGLFSSKYIWLIMLGVCVVPHLWMMFKGNKEHNSTEKKENEKHDGSCCH